MSLIRYLWFLVRQLVGFAVGTRRPGLLVLVVLAGVIVLAGFFVQLLAPLAIYPFL